MISASSIAIQSPVHSQGGREVWVETMLRKFVAYFLMGCRQSAKTMKPEFVSYTSFILRQIIINIKWVSALSDCGHISVSNDIHLYMHIHGKQSKKAVYCGGVGQL